MDDKENNVVDLLQRDGVKLETPSNIVNKPYKFRKLTSKDISPMVRILKKIELKRIKELFSSEEIKNLIQNKQNEEETEEDNTESSQDLMKLGGNLLIEAIPMLLDAVDNCIGDVNILLASVANMEVAELENLDLDVYFNMVYDFVNKEEFSGFLKVVSKFLK